MSKDKMDNKEIVEKLKSKARILQRMGDQVKLPADGRYYLKEAALFAEAASKIEEMEEEGGRR